MVLAHRFGWLLLGLPSGIALAQETAPTTDDPFLWLEEVEGTAALDWVRGQNERTVAAYGSTESFKSTEARMLAALDSTDKIPGVVQMGDWLYNFWRDGEHPRGVWRRTSWASYRTEAPEWEVVLDVDALATAESESWVWHGADCLQPAYQRCLVRLSPGGTDADVVREFDVPSKAFVEGGFQVPLAKSDTAWVDIDHLFVGSDFGEGTLTESGYPRTTRLWTRGTPLESAPVVFEGNASDIAVVGYRSSTFSGDQEMYGRNFVVQALTFFTDDLYEVTEKGNVRIEKPDHTQATVIANHIYFEPRKDWEVDGVTYPSGSLLAADYKKWMKGKRKLTVLFTPTERVSLQRWTHTKDHLFLTILDNVRTRVEMVTPAGKSWTHTPLGGLPELASVSIGAVDSNTSNDVWVDITDFLTPTSLGVLSPGGQLEVLKTTPAFFNAETHTVTQHMAKSKDGTEVPYFQVAPKVIPDGGLPTLLYGYGGFEVSLLPYYSSTVGIGWIERGGAYVVANIRGGGEFGPRWHQAALKEKRHKAYEDFAAVGEDLVQRGVTTVPALGIQGGSNGGLLMGNMYATYPDHWGAVVCQVPLLDMRRYTKLLAGASWAGEYGDPDDPAQWSFIQQYSPYHSTKMSDAHPPILFTTSTRDDRVHPGHARKMAARLLEAGKDVAYYENIEGGHGGAANNAQQAFMRTLAYEFLWRQLTGDAPKEAAAPEETAAPQ